MLVPGSIRYVKKPMAAHLDALLRNSNILSLLNCGFTHGTLMEATIALEMV